MSSPFTVPSLSPNEAACVTGVPLKQVHRIIDAGLLGDAARGGNRARAIRRDGLVGLKLAHETTEVLTPEGRRRLVRFVLDHPQTIMARERHVSVDVRSVKCDVRKGLSLLAKAREVVSCDDAVLAGTPCIVGTRIPIHDIAEMIANGDGTGSIQAAFPQLSESQIELAIFYTRAYPRRGRPRRKPSWRGREPVASSETALNELSSTRRSS